ncbi:hypothetical protein LOTGIDRAFT_235774 [Lottia gigantea]|uniref:non-specific serine/threonine protein kinase n=1 Tax=Lottia gigantea TaxID=225164 RepID=V3Z536_LOTGI|nr:hypothetical protein LOTGIDRAFT_235774 [Lottia gigantea]ESO85823.1 hypothetical protein LOTGIDRAFT_235774 [Lottia gigantea]
MNKDQLLINESGWRPPEGLLPNGFSPRVNHEVPVYYARRSNKIESAGKKKVTSAPYDVANKKIKKGRSCKGSKSIPSIEELGIELRDEEEELEEYEEFENEDVKKVQDDFEKGHVVYGKTEAFTSILKQYKTLDGIQGVISSNVMDEICISPRKLYDVNKNFTRGDLLGEGGVGKVHYVTDNLSKEKFVEKTIKKEKFARKEVEVLLSLQHRNITEFYGLIVNEESISVFMSFAGTSLETLIIRNKMIFSEDEVICLSIQAMSALAYMHQYSLVHMDIKPQNICIKPETGHLSLTDFGSSLTPQDNLEFAGVTPEYMSPELCRLFVDGYRKQRGKGPQYLITRDTISGKNDVYAWACTMLFFFLRNHAALMFVDPKKCEDFRYLFLFQVANQPQMMRICVPGTIKADLKSIVVDLLNGEVEKRPSAEQGKCILEGIKQRRCSNEQTYRPLESRDEKHASIKLKLKEKIENKMRTDGSSATRQPDSKPTVDTTKDESSETTGTQNIPNFDSLF